MAGVEFLDAGDMYHAMSPVATFLFMEEEDELHPVVGFFTFTGLIAVVFLNMSVFLLWILTIGNIIDSPQKRCDQPLALYIVVASIALGLVAVSLPSQQHTLRLWESGNSGTWRASLIVRCFLTVVSGSIVIAWGDHIVFGSHTCSLLDPTLFFQTKVIVMSQPLLWLEILLYLGTQHRMFTQHSVRRRGCVEIVRAMPKVPPDAAELLYPEDGMVRDCPICQDTLACLDPVVRTTCMHLFHEECLVRWCTIHLDCPACRAVFRPPG
jgi:hypothetical protein